MKKKIMKHLSAVMLSVLIFFGGVSGAYIDGYCAGNDRFLDVIWNYDESVTANLLQYAVLVTSWLGAAAEPSLLGEATFGAVATANFLHYMNSDKPEDQQMTEEDIPAYFEKNVTRKHGGGGLSFSDEVVDALHYTAKAYLDEKCGYVMYPTLPVSKVPASLFETKEGYNAFCQSVRNCGYILANFYFFSGNTTDSCVYVPPVDFSGFYSPVAKNLSSYGGKCVQLSYLDNNWKSHSVFHLWNYVSKITSSDQVLNSFSDAQTSGTFSLSFVLPTSFSLVDSKNMFAISSDGRALKVWYDLSSYKNYTVGVQPYYVTNAWVNYDYSVDNSITISDSYINSNVHNGNVVNNYNNIQNTINNANPDGSLTEDEIYDIVQDAMKDYFDESNKDDTGGGSGDSGNTGGDSGDTGGDSGDTGGGSGVGSVIDGVGSLLDTVLNIIGKLLSLLSGFVESVLALFEGFTIFTDGFSGFLTATFGFIPAEAINVIVSGITLMVILAVIKFLK